MFRERLRTFNFYLTLPLTSHCVCVATLKSLEMTFDKGVGAKKLLEHLLLR